MIREQLKAVRDTLADGVALVAVSKFHPAAAIEEAYAEGQRVFGESREQELRTKHETLPTDIQWHFIGHLQTNKVRYIAPYVSVIETVDSLRLMQEIDRQAQRCGRVIDILLELHLAQEESKSGFEPDELLALLATGEPQALQGIRIRGIMMMATQTDDETQIAAEFDRAATLFDKIQAEYFADSADFNIRSYGMSHDYRIAQQHRATHVRIGTAIFGARA